MKTNKTFKLTLVFLLFIFLLIFTGCQSGKKFDTADDMIAEMTGTYQGSEEHSGERIIIDGENIIKFNIDNIFAEITDDDIFKENFTDEDWKDFDIDALLSKSYIAVTKEPISADIKKSSISGLWINKSGVLYSQVENGYPFNKISSDSNYPTTEMKEKFEEYNKYLQEYEISSIITEAENNLSEKQKSLESTLSSATSTTVAIKSTASAETIAECAFESLKDHLKYPRSATLDSYTTVPNYDSYGRVQTLISVTCQNGFGNYITEGYYVVLQSCDYFGKYTYNRGIHYIKETSGSSDILFAAFMMANSWDTDPNYDSKKDPSYNASISLIKDRKYSLAIEKLNDLGDYRKSSGLKSICISYLKAEKYKGAVDLFSDGKYPEAIKELTTLLKDNDEESSSDSGYLRAERIITLCNAAIEQASADESESEGKTADTGKDDLDKSEITEDNKEDSSSNSSPSENTNDNEIETSDSNDTTALSENDSSGSNSATNSKPANPCANGHSWKEATCTEPEICTVCGATNGSAKGHSWKEATCTEPATCTVCGTTSGSAKGHSWNEATCSSPKKCQVCKITEGSALPHDMYYTKCTMCDYADFSNYTLNSNTFSSDSWFYLGNESETQYLRDGEASINIDKSGVCKVEFDKYSYTFTLVQSEYDVYGLHFDCYMNGQYVENTEVTFYFSQNRCSFFNYGGTLGFSQVALNFDM